MNRLLAVATAIFAAPAAVEIYALASGGGAPSLAAACGILAAAVVATAGFGGLVATAPRLPALRAARVLSVALAAETAVLASAVAWQLFA